MRPMGHRVHIYQIEDPHIVQRQRVLVEQPIPHDFVTFQLTVGAKRFRVRHPVTKHSAQLRRELRQRKHVTVTGWYNTMYMNESKPCIIV